MLDTLQFNREWRLWGKIVTSRANAKGFRTSSCHILFLVRKHDREANFFAFTVTLNNAVNDGRLSCLGMGVVGTNYVYLNIRAL